MINKLYQAISDSLKAVRACNVYQESIRQNFTAPSWLVMFYDQNPVAGINGCINNKVRVDVAYFPRNDVGANAECWETGQSLVRDFRLEGFKIRNRNLKITDKVLHFMFDVDYREYPDTNTPAMRTLSQDTDIKEE